MAFYFDTPVVIVDNLLKYFPTQPAASVTWGLGMLDAARLPGQSGTALVIGFGNMSSAEEFPVLMFHIANNGKATAESSVLGSLNWPSYAGPVLANDFNADGINDILLPGAGGHNPDDSIGGEVPAFALSDGANGWTDASADLPQENFYAHSWAVGDVDGNGANDILLMNNVFNEQNPLPVLLLNDGTGHFTASRDKLPSSIVDSSAFDRGMFYQYSFAASTFVDVDNDGDLDVALPETNALYWSSDPAYLPDGMTDGVVYRKTAGQIWLNDGSGNFSVSAALPEVDPGNPRGLYFTTNIAAFDVNGDGFQDLAYATTPLGTDGHYSGYYADSLLQIMLNDGTGNFVRASDRVSGSADSIDHAWASTLTVCDAEGDGDLDIFARICDGEETGSSAWLNRGVTAYLNDGTGHFTATRASKAIPDSIFTGNHLVTDINGDGLQDVVFSDNGTVWNGTQFAGAIRVAYGKITVDRGTAGDDVIQGLAGNDKIAAGAGNDTIIAGAGNDKISADSGNDRVDGGAGADKMTGGADADVFVFRNLATGGADTIADFGSGDRLEFDTTVFTALVGIDASSFVSGKTAQTADQHLIYDSTRGTLYYDADGSGGTAAIRIVTVKGTGAKALGFGDFDFA